MTSIEKEKAQANEELKEVKKLADEANAKLSEALVAQKRAEESSEIEKFRADELEQAGIEAAQKREQEWQKELEEVRNQHAIDVTALLTVKQELQRVKQELVMTSEAKNTALCHADDAMKIAEINAEKVGFLSGELSRMKELLDSKLETKSNEAAELVQKLNSEINLLKQELERSRIAEEKLCEMETLTEVLKTEVTDAKRAASDADNLVDEWKKKVELLEAQIEEATKSERSASESLASLMKQLEGNKVQLKDAESEIASLTQNVESLEIMVGRHKMDLEESDWHLERAKQEGLEMKKAAETLKSELQAMEEEKTQAVSNEMLALSSIESLTEEKNKLMNELAASRDEEEKSKNAMETLASALHEVSMEARDAKENLAANRADLENAESQIEDLKSALKATKEKYEAMLDETKEKMSCLGSLVEESQEEVKSSKAKLDKKELDFAASMKKSEEELVAVKRNMGILAENLKAEWHEKELGFISAIKKSEEEITALRKKMDGLINLLKGTEEAAQAAKEDVNQARDTLKRAESEASSANEAAKKAVAETFQLKEKLLDKETELQSITQENDDLRTREAAALGRIEELSKLLAEALAKKTEDNGELSSSEKSYDLLPKMIEFAEENENVNGSGEEKSKPELPLEQIEEPREGEDLSGNSNVLEQKVENGNGNAKEREEEYSSMVEVKMLENCNVAEDMSPEREAEPGSFEDELDPKIDGDKFDQINGLSPQTTDNGGSSQSKRQHKKKQPLLSKFGSLLKKKSNSKQ